MQLPINKDGNIELDLFEIISEIVNEPTEEGLQTIIDYLDFQKPIRMWRVESLAEEYSRPCCRSIYYGLGRR